MAELGKLTRRLESTLGRLLGTQTGDASASEPLELIAGILHDVEQQVEPIGGGRRRFPFTQVGVVILATRKDDQDRCAAALEDLGDKIRARLRELACDPPARLDVAVQFARKPRKHWAADQRIELSFSRETSASTAPGTRVAGGVSQPSVRVVVLRGTATKRTYTFEQGSIRFGRGEDHAEASGQTRRNDVAFHDDQDEMNRTVARAQAHVRFDPARRELRVFDDGSSNGTRVVRESEVIPVTPHGPRGVRIAHGDIIELGRARVRIDLE